jgi:hypothetical protein
VRIVRDPLHVLSVTMTEATRVEIRRGLLGYLVIELPGDLVIEGATVRRSRQGVRTVSFPRNRKGYHYLWVRTIEARHDLERQVFEKLGVQTSHSHTYRSSRERGGTS